MGDAPGLREGSVSLPLPEVALECVEQKVAEVAVLFHCLHLRPLPQRNGQVERGAHRRGTRRPRLWHGPQHGRLYVRLASALPVRDPVEEHPAGPELAATLAVRLAEARRSTVFQLSALSRFSLL